MDFHLPELGEGVYEAELVSWLVKPGDTVKSGQNLLEVMTDKATMEVPAPFAGTITALHATPGKRVKVGDPVLSYTPAGVPAPVSAAPAAPAAKSETPLPALTRPGSPAPPTSNGTPASSRVPVKAAPSVRFLARKLGVDLGQVRGSGPEGRVLVDDLSSHVSAGSPAEKKPAPAPLPEF